MNKLFIPIILGTGRGGSQSEKVASLVFRELKRPDVETLIVGVRDYAPATTIPAWVDSPKTRSWKKIANRAQAFIIVTPEYNHGYPGELKLLLDSAFEEYDKKPVALCTVSSGTTAGARVQLALLPVFAALRLTLVPQAVQFARVDRLFDDGELTDTSYIERLDLLFDELVWYAQMLKKGRETSVLVFKS